MGLDIPKELELRAIHADDHLGKLSLGNPDYTPLKIFLKKAVWIFMSTILRRPMYWQQWAYFPQGYGVM